MSARRQIHWVSVLILFFLWPLNIFAQLPFVRGDANADGEVDLSDSITTLFHLFLGRQPDCLAALDADDDLEVTITDPILILNFLFRSGPPPAQPYPACGFSRSSLPCERSGGCLQVRARETVTPAGAALEIDADDTPLHGALLTIPEGALEEPIEITLSTSDAEPSLQALAPEGYSLEALTPTLVLSPAGLSFAKPVILRLPPTDVPSDRFLRIFQRDASGTSEELVYERQEDGSVTVSLPHFSSVDQTAQKRLPEGPLTVGYVIDSPLEDRNLLENYDVICCAFAVPSLSVSGYLNTTKYSRVLSKAYVEGLHEIMVRETSRKILVLLSLHEEDDGDRGLSSEDFHDICEDTTKREKLIESTVALVDDRGFDGVDIDWEHAVDKGLYSDFTLELMAALRERCGDEAVASSTLARWVYDDRNARVDLDALFDEGLDLFQIMAYDAWDIDTSSTRPSYDNESERKYTIRGALEYFTDSVDPENYGRVICLLHFYARHNDCSIDRYGFGDMGCLDLTDNVNFMEASFTCRGTRWWITNPSNMHAKASAAMSFRVDGKARTIRGTGAWQLWQDSSNAALSQALYLGTHSKPLPVDSDGDGFPDSSDACPTVCNFSSGSCAPADLPDACECAHDADRAPCDGSISDAELQSYIEDWKADLVCEKDLLRAIEIWKLDCSGTPIDTDGDSYVDTCVESSCPGGGYCTESFSGPWISVFSDAGMSQVYFVGDGQGNVTDGSLLNLAPLPSGHPGSYTVARDGEIRIRVNNKHDGIIELAGRFTHESVITMSDPAGKLLKPVDLNRFDGDWNGTMADDSGGTSRSLRFSVSSTGAVEGFSGDLPAPISGDFYGVDEHITGRFKTGDEGHLRQIMVWGTLFGNTFSGNFQSDTTEPAGHGSVDLHRQ